MQNKQILVVGGTSGIGLELSKQLQIAGAKVTVISRSNNIEKQLPGITYFQADVTSDDLSSPGLPEVLDGLVYCPGSIHLKPFRSIKPEQFISDFNVNVLGAVRVLQAALRSLKKGADPSVVLFSTVAVKQGMPFHTSVAAAKGAVEGLARSLAAEWAPGIRVNCIAPSLTDTPLAQRLLSTADKREASGNRHPLKRIGTPGDIASLAYFLLSDKSSWLTGQVVGVDGGLSTLNV